MSRNVGRAPRRPPWPDGATGGDAMWDIRPRATEALRRGPGRAVAGAVDIPFPPRPDRGDGGTVGRKPTSGLHRDGPVSEMTEGPAGPSEVISDASAPVWPLPALVSIHDGLPRRPPGRGSAAATVGQALVVGVACTGPLAPERRVTAPRYFCAMPPSVSVPCPPAGTGHAEGWFRTRWPRYLEVHDRIDVAARVVGEGAVGPRRTA